MIRNFTEYLEKRLKFDDFMRSQAILIERYDEVVAVCNAMKEVAMIHDNKKRQLKKFIAEVQAKVGEGIKVELTKKERDDKKDKPRVYITTNTRMAITHDIRIMHSVLFTVWVYEFIEDDDVFNADKVKMVANDEIRRAKELKAKVKEECAHFGKWDKTLEDALQRFYDNIKDIPNLFLEFESRCFGELSLR